MARSAWRRIFVSVGGIVDNPGARAIGGIRLGGPRALFRTVEFLFIAVLYFALAKASLAFASIHPSATPVWPPTGLALALTLLRGPRILPAIFIGALAANATNAGSIATSVAIAFGNTAEAFVGAWLMKLWADGRRAFQTPSGVAKFALIVAGAATPISATVGVGALGVGGFTAGADIPAIWTTWWLGDVAGAVMVAPAVVLWARTLWWREPWLGVTWEPVLLMAFAAAIGLFALGPVLPPSSERNALAFLTVLPLLWSALRRGQRDTATIALLLSAFAVWGVAVGTGPFVQENLNDSLLLLVSFIAATTLPSLGLSAAVASQERARAKSEEDYHRLVDSVRDYAIFMLDTGGHIATWNAGAERIKRYTREEIVGKHFSCFYTPEDRAQNVPARALANAAEKGAHEGEGWRLRNDGSRFWASVVITAIRDERGVLVGFAKVTRDITNARDAQNSLEQTRERLHQAQKLEALGQLTGVVAHDFNNLLMTISGGVSLLRSARPESREKILEEMQQSVERGAGLTRHLLDFARREALRPETFDAAERLSTMRDMLRRSLGPAIRLESRFQEGLWPIHVDPGQFELAILNLVINARDAMSGGGLLSIEATNETVGPGDREFVRIRVRDTGAGMTDETMAHAFEPFYSTKAPGHGTGLGLSQVHGFAEQSGGSVEIDSTLGSGTVVTLVLPRARETVPAPATEREPERFEGTGNVLVVEDDDRVASVVCAMVEDLGYRVTRVSSGIEALAALERGDTYELVFSDVVMPGELNGLQLAAAIRERQPGLPVLLTSGYSGAAQGRTDIGFPILQKPYGASDLSAAFRAALASNGD
jgi:PAS domain S-box-containing protein